MPDSVSGRLIQIFNILLDSYGQPHCTLTHENSYELLVAVVLSAQCTDERVNQITPILFDKYPTLPAMADADLDLVEQIIRPLGFSKVKSSYIVNACKMIIETFNGQIPTDIESLTRLPGFGRKSANVILGNCFDIPGFPVDTHVNRVLNRLGVVNEKRPEKIEAFINQNLPDNYWTNLSHLLIQHGRNCCKARKPQCPSCPLSSICDSFGSF